LRPLVDFESVTFFCRDLADEPPVPQAVSRRCTYFTPVTIRRAVAMEVERLPWGDAPGRGAEDLRRRFERGDQCTVVEAPDGSLVHTSWLTTSRGYIPELDSFILLGPGEACFDSAYTLPEWRRRRLSVLSGHYSLSRLSAQGFKRIYAYVIGDSPRSWSDALLIGLQPVGRLFYLRSLGRILLFQDRPRVGAHIEPAPPNVAPAGRGNKNGQKITERLSRPWILAPVAHVGVQAEPPAERYQNLLGLIRRRAPR
jgi:hypothetical protein